MIHIHIYRDIQALFNTHSFIAWILGIENTTFLLLLQEDCEDYDDGQMKGCEGYSILDFLKILKLLKSKEK